MSNHSNRSIDSDESVEYMNDGPTDNNPDGRGASVEAADNAEHNRAYDDGVDDLPPG